MVTGEKMFGMGKLQELQHIIVIAFCFICAGVDLVFFCCERRGVYRSQDGSVYDGEWRDNARNGYGRFTGRDGSYYLGDWMSGLRNGKGVCRLFLLLRWMPQFIYSSCVNFCSMKRSPFLHVGITAERWIFLRREMVG